MFWIAVGMLIMLFIPELWIALMVIGFLMICGYNMFCR